MEKVEEDRNAPIVVSLQFLTTNAGVVELFISRVDIEMTDEQRAKCHAIINTASVATAGVGGGFSQIPGSDNLAIIPIQLTMTI